MRHPDDPARRKELREHGLAYLPSPAKIHRECRIIRESWTPTERAQRLCGGVRPRWQMPVDVETPEGSEPNDTSLNVRN